MDLETAFCGAYPCAVDLKIVSMFAEEDFSQGPFVEGRPSGLLPEGLKKAFDGQKAVAVRNQAEFVRAVPQNVDHDSAQFINAESVVFGHGVFPWLRAGRFTGIPALVGLWTQRDRLRPFMTLLQLRNGPCQTEHAWFEGSAESEVGRAP
jgi:hypothetical protein